MSNDLYSNHIQCSDESHGKFGDIKQKTQKKMKIKVSANLLISLLHKHSDKIVQIITKDL